MDETLLQAVFEECRDSMRKAVARTQSEFGTVRTGRATSAVVERLHVDYYGSEVPLQQIAGFSIPEGRLLVITPYDKSSLGAIEKAIQNSDVGINPSNDGNVIRLAFPTLTEERRKELVKLVKKMSEEGRVAVRGARRSARQDLEKMQKDGDISTDELERAEGKLESITKDFVAEIDKHLADKEQELLTV